MGWDEEESDWDDQTILVDESITDNRSATIWRYTNLPGFINLMTEQSLFCSRADSFEDPYEGRLSESSHQRLRENYKMTTGGIELFESNIELIEELRKVTYLNCWRIDEYEDYGMWHAYTDSYSGLAIKTTVGGLIDSIQAGAGYEGRLALQSVDYIDYESDDQDSTGEGVFFPFRFKRIQHKNEKEFRMLVTDYPHRRMRADESFDAPDDQPTTRKISIDPSALIEEVRLHPESDATLEQAVKNTVAEMGMAMDTERIHRSSLDDLNP